jgi:hypothetical protein
MFAPQVGKPFGQQVFQTCDMALWKNSNDRDSGSHER